MSLQRLAVSRKIAAKKSGSRASSKAGSIANSDDENEFSDNDSVTSIDSSVSQSWGPTNTSKAWEEELKTDIEALLERKGSSVQGREITLQRLNKNLCLQYCREAIGARDSELVNALVRIVKGARSELECVQGTRSLDVLCLTSPDIDTLHELAVPVFKNIITNSPYLVAKAACLHALATCVTVYADTNEIADIIDFLIEIIENDGDTVDAGGEAGLIVSSAIDALAFCISSIPLPVTPDEVESDVVSALEDQLDSDDSDVRIAAGECLALIAEMSAVDPDDEDAVKEYNTNPPFSDVHRLTQILAELSTSSSKRQSKSNRRIQHSVFRDILTTISNPHMRDSAPTETLKFGKSTFTIDSWRINIRYAHLRKILKSGLDKHFTKSRLLRSLLDHGELATTGNLSSSMYSTYGTDDDGDRADDEVEMDKDVKKEINRELSRIRQKERKTQRSNKTMESNFIGDDEV